MKYKIIDRVSRFVKRFGMIMDPETMNKAKAEAEDYDFRLISKDHYTVRHADKMYVIIERDGQIGCSCNDMTYNRMDGSVCKHIIAFSRLMEKITELIDDADRGFLVNIGWTGKELHPPELQIPPDPDLDLGVDDPLPEPEPLEPEKPVKVSAKCQYCGMGATRKNQEVADAWKEVHEAQCPKNPANIPEKPDSSKPDKEQKQEETKMEDKTAWNQAAWDSATQGSFVTYNDEGIAIVLFTANDFEMSTKPDKWGRASFEFAVIQNDKAVVLSVGSIRLMNALKGLLPIEGKMVKIVRTGEGTGTKYEVEEVKS